MISMNRPKMPYALSGQSSSSATRALASTSAARLARPVTPTFSSLGLFDLSLGLSGGYPAVTRTTAPTGAGTGDMVVA